MASTSDVGAAAPTQHAEVGVAPHQVGVLGGQLERVTVVELLGLVELGVART